MEPQSSKPFSSTPNEPNSVDSVPPSMSSNASTTPPFLNSNTSNISTTSTTSATSRKNLYFVIGSAVLLLIVLAVVVGIVIFNSKQSNPNPTVVPSSSEQSNDQGNVSKNFEFTIVDDSVPGGSTTFSIEGNQVGVNEYDACSAVDCKGSSNTVSFEFSDENIDKLYEFYETELAGLVSESNNGEKLIFEHKLDYYQLDVINALTLGEDQFAHDVQPLRYQVYIDYPYESSDSDTYKLKIPEDGSPYVVKVTYKDGVKYDYYDLDFDSRGFESIDELIASLTPDPSSSERDRVETYAIEYDEAMPAQKIILDAIIENDDSKI